MGLVIELQGRDALWGGGRSHSDRETKIKHTMEYGPAHGIARGRLRCDGDLSKETASPAFQS